MALLFASPEDRVPRIEAHYNDSPEQYVFMVKDET